MLDFSCLYERFDPTVPLEAADPAYIDWQSRLEGLVDVKQQLRTSVLLTRHSYIHRLFTGVRGGGKTTELRRLQADLQGAAEGQRYFVSFLDAADSLDLDDADATDLVLSVVRQLVSDLRELSIRVTAGGRMRTFLTSARDILLGMPESGIDITVGDPLGIVQLSSTLKNQPSLRRQVRDLLEGNLPTLYDAINLELLPAARAQLVELGYAGMLVIVDQLDRMPPDGDRHRAVFWEGRGKLKALDCHVVYTTPIEYAYSRALPTLENEYGELLGLPLLPVAAQDAAVSGEALRLTRAVATARLAACEAAELDLFERTSILDDLSRLSGGHMRSLFLLIRTAIEASGLSAPLTSAHVDRVVDRLAAKYLDPLEAVEREVVRGVHRTKSRPDGDRELDRFYDLLRDQYVFAYAVGEQRWYDWNPLLSRSNLDSR